MPEPEKTSVQPIENLPITMIGTRMEGTGTPIVDGQVIKTPDGQPNITIRVVGPFVAIATRAITVFGNTLLGGLGVSAGATITGAFPWATWQAALVIAASAAIISIIQSVVTITSNLEKKYPLLGGL